MKPEQTRPGTPTSFIYLFICIIIIIYIILFIYFILFYFLSIYFVSSPVPPSVKGPGKTSVAPSFYLLY